MFGFVRVVGEKYYRGYWLRNVSVLGQLVACSCQHHKRDNGMVDVDVLFHVVG